MDSKYIDITLKSQNKTLEIGQKHILQLKEAEGLETVETEHSMSDNIQWQGSTIDHKHISYRSIDLTLLDQDVKNAETIRQQVMAFFNPNSAGTLTIDYSGFEREIAYVVKSFKEKDRNLWEPFECMVVLVCEDPYYKSIITESSEISTWIGGLKFPFKLPFHLKRRGEPRVNIVNSGHVETPVQIIFKGPAYNPTVRLLQTGEYIRVKRELTSDDTLYIDTTFGVNSVEIERDGVRENAFSAIDWRSDFFQLRVGDNLVEYTTENQLVPQSVDIRFRERYLGA